MRFNSCRYCLLLLLVPIFSGCGTSLQRAETVTRTDKPAPVIANGNVAKGGGYYQDDGPGDNPPPNIDAIPDAEPREEPLHKFANNRYAVLGQQYTPDTASKNYKAKGMASWYGKKFHGKKTSSGEPYDMYGMTAAHPTLPIPSYVRVTNVKTRKSVVVRVNDRGPFHSERLIDLSYTAAHKLGIVQHGSAMVEVESVRPGDSVALATQPIMESPLPGAPETASVPIVAELSGVYLQLASFNSQDNAQNFSSKVRQQLGNLSEALHILPKDGVFRVNLGPYRNKSEASQASNKIRQSLDLSPLLLVIR